MASTATFKEQYVDSPLNCRNITHESNITGDYCNATWDSITCWAQTPARTVAKQPCPPIFGARIGSFVYRTCGADGEWTSPEFWEGFGYSDYKECVSHLNMLEQVFDVDNVVENKAEDVSNVVEIMTKPLSALVMSSLSTISLLASLICLARITKSSAKQSAHYIISMYFSITLLIEASVVNVINSFYYLNIHEISKAALDSSNRSTKLCELLVAVQEYPCLLGYMWLLIRIHHLYLTTKSDRLAVSGILLYRLVGWGAPLIPVAIWVVTSAFGQPMACWKYHQKQPIIWILECPKYLMMGFNLIYLFLAKCHLSHSLKIVNKRCCYRRIVLEMRLCMLAYVILLVIISFTTVCQQIIQSSNTDLVAALEIVYSTKGLMISLIVMYFNADLRQTVITAVARISRLQPNQHVVSAQHWANVGTTL